jgi:hypothetical protein
MNIMMLQKFFMWCTIINGFLYILTAVISVYASDWLYGMHSRWFHLSRETFNVALYSFLGFFKIIFLIFNVVPYIVLLIVG